MFVIKMRYGRAALLGESHGAGLLPSATSHHLTCRCITALIIAKNILYGGSVQDSTLAGLRNVLAQDTTLQQGAAQHLILISNRMIEGAHPHREPTCILLLMSCPIRVGTWRLPRGCSGYRPSRWYALSSMQNVRLYRLSGSCYRHLEIRQRSCRQ